MHTDTTQPDSGDQIIRLRRDLRCSLLHDATGSYYLIEDPLRTKFFRLGTREWTFAELLDGKNTLREATARATAVLDKQMLSQQQISQLCAWLNSTELIERSRATAVQGTSKLQQAVQRMNLLFIRIPLFNPNMFLERLLPFFAWTFSLPATIVWAIVCIAGVQQVLTHWDRFTRAAEGVLAPSNWLTLLGVWILLKIFHELFHGLACKLHGGSVPRAGLMLILFSPIAFVDVTSSWRFRSKWHRLNTSAAGMYVEFFIAGIAALVWSQTDTGVINHMCHDIVLAATLTTLLFNGNFLMRFDGYYIISDLLDIQNLYGSGQAYVRYLLRRYYLGLRETPPLHQSSKRNFIRVYGVASLLWRISLCVSLTIGAAVLFHGAGLVLAIIAVVAWVGLPLANFGHYMIYGNGFDRPPRKRFALTSAVLALFVYIVFSLPWPGGLSAPAIVEYSPLTIVRANCPGLIREVHVQAGELVMPGDVLMVLTDPDTERDLADIRIAIQQSVVRSRVNHRDREMDKYLIEVKNRELLHQREKELEQKAASLTVKATVEGMVIGRQLDTLPGTYAEVGQSLLALGKEEHKELQLLIPQQHVKAFTNCLDSLTAVQIKGNPRKITAKISRIEPRASSVLVHEALGANVGGPLPIKPQTDGDDQANMALVIPHIQAAIELSRQQSLELFTGQLADVRVWPIDETIGRHLWQLSQAWLRDQLTAR